MATPRTRTDPPDPPAPTSRENPSPPPARAGTFRALRHRNYQLYFVGQIVSLTGWWVQATALTWLAYALTDQSRWPALVSAAQVVPMLLLGVWGGSLADRWPRRPLIFAAQSGLLVLALVLAAMVALDRVNPVGLLAVSLLIGVVNAIDTPARLAFVIDMVGRDDLINAVALNSLVFNAARAIGPAVGGVLLPRVGAAGCFLVNALTFIAVLLALLAMRLPARQTGPVARAEAGPAALGEGFRFLASQPGLLLLLVLAGAMAFFGWPVLALLPALADRIVATREAAGYAWMLSGTGAGALVAALILASFATVTTRQVFLAAGVVLGAVGLAGLAVASSQHAAVLCCALTGGGLILFFATGQATMQLGASEHNRGRVLGIWLMVLSGAQPAGNIVAGYAADRYGVALVLALQAAGIASVAVLVTLAWLSRSWNAGNEEEEVTPRPAEAASSRLEPRG